MIKQACISAILLVAVSTSNAQSNKYFEGKIAYEFDLISKNEKIDSNYLRSLFGYGSVLIFKQGSFYHQYNGGLMEFDMYKKEDNKAYIKKRGNDTIFWFNCASAGDKIEKLLFAAKKEKILGISCDELVIQYKDKTESHYYNADSIAINPDWFKRFKHDGENIIDQKEKSIFLKSKIDYYAILVIQTATKISRERVNGKIFEIPANAILSEQKQ